ncbi:signal peptidase I [Ruminococcus flavefaciens]|uniref:Signal peptidase I n=1 Tax=Ruminococcus flavefaciens 007c TaxID=1341157 RepID=W7V0H8_RUMFL|nr:signal peptidase I [Ruminococcus flavefaciens]EWM54535.1 hypothetical protein RF007C_01015 [Ruminococcus flavefaciens 007c]
MEEKKQQKLAVRILRSVYNLIATALIALGAVTAVLWVAGIRPYAVVSGSMEPAIKVGSICVVNHHASFSKVKKGDIIAFKAGDSTLVTHRAVRVTDEGISTKGDANNTEDTDPVTSRNFIGRTIFSIPAVGYFIGFVHTTHGLIAAAASLAAFILIGMVIPDKKKGKKK